MAEEQVTRIPLFRLYHLDDLVSDVNERKQPFNALPEREPIPIHHFRDHILADDYPGDLRFERKNREKEAYWREYTVLLAGKMAGFVYVPPAREMKEENFYDVS